MFSSYYRELYMRKDFFNNRMIKELEGKKHQLEKERLNEALGRTSTSLRESEARFRTLAETTAAAIFIHQGERLLYANPAGEMISGYTSEELQQRDFWTFIHPEYPKMVRERGPARVRGEQVPREDEFKFNKKGGDECWVSVTTGSIEYKRQPAIIVTLFDITAWKHAEEAKTRFYEESVRQYQERIDVEKNTSWKKRRS